MTLKVIIRNICETLIFYTGRLQNGSGNLLWTDVSNMHERRNTIKKLHTEGHVLYKCHYRFFHWDWMAGRWKAAQSESGPLVSLLVWMRTLHGPHVAIENDCSSKAFDLIVFNYCRVSDWMYFNSVKFCFFNFRSQVRFDFFPVRKL